MAVTWKRAGDSIQISSDFKYTVPTSGRYKIGGDWSFSIKTKLVRLKDSPEELYECIDVPRPRPDGTIHARPYTGKDDAWSLHNKSNFIELDKDDIAKILYEKENEE